MSDVGMLDVRRQAFERLLLTVFRRDSYQWVRLCFDLERTLADKAPDNASALLALVTYCPSKSDAAVLVLALCWGSSRLAGQRPT